MVSLINFIQYSTIMDIFSQWWRTPSNTTKSLETFLLITIKESLPSTTILQTLSSKQTTALNKLRNTMHLLAANIWFILMSSRSIEEAGILHLLVDWNKTSLFDESCLHTVITNWRAISPHMKAAAMVHAISHAGTLGQSKLDILLRTCILNEVTPVTTIDNTAVWHEDVDINLALIASDLGFPYFLSSYKLVNHLDFHYTCE